MAQVHKRMSTNATGCGSIVLRSVSRQSAALRSVTQHTYTTSKIRRKVRKRSVLTLEFPTLLQNYDKLNLYVMPFTDCDYCNKSPNRFSLSIIFFVVRNNFLSFVLVRCLFYFIFLASRCIPHITV